METFTKSVTVFTSVRTSGLPPTSNLDLQVCTIVAARARIHFTYLIVTVAIALVKTMSQLASSY